MLGIEQVGAQAQGNDGRRYEAQPESGPTEGEHNGYPNGQVQYQ